MSKGKGNGHNAYDKTGSRGSSVKVNFRIEGVRAKERLAGADKQLVDYVSAGEEFSSIMLMLQSYKKLISDVAQRVTDSNQRSLVELLKEVIKENGSMNPKKCVKKSSAKVILEVKESDASRQKEVAIGISDYNLAERLQNLAENYNRTRRILAETVLQQLVNTWEHLIGDLLISRYLISPIVMEGTSSIAVRKVLDAESYDAVLRIAAEDAVKRCLMSDFNEQLKTIKDVLGVDLRSSVPQELIDRLQEVFLRRNLFVHCGGVANREFISKEKSLFKNASFELGVRVQITEDYLDSAWQTIYTIGLALAFLAELGYARSNHKEEGESIAITHIANYAAEAIRVGCYKSAQDMLEMVSLRSIKRMTNMLHVRINLALAYKESGMKDKLKETLDLFEDSACAPIYQACIAALRSDYEAAYKAFERVKLEDPQFVADVYSWPVFSELRAQETFGARIKKIFPDSEKVAKRLDMLEIISSSNSISPATQKGMVPCSTKRMRNK